MKIQSRCVQGIFELLCSLSSGDFHLRGDSTAQDLKERERERERGGEREREVL